MVSLHRETFSFGQKRSKRKHTETDKATTQTYTHSEVMHDHMLTILIILYRGWGFGVVEPTSLPHTVFRALPTLLPYIHLRSCGQLLWKNVVQLST